MSGDGLATRSQAIREWNKESRLWGSPGTTSEGVAGLVAVSMGCIHGCVYTDVYTDVCVVPTKLES